ncbi:MAG TPA: acyl-CoA dehydrogenase family protein [Acidimicrobiia bacterium]|nr:acyl-CoA dehydrogenase family protein [Acidimicrobiia bacterium]
MSQTHEVLNQPPPLEGYNLYLSDPVLDRAVAREGGKDARDTLIEFGATAGSARYYRWGFEADRNNPRLVTHDRFGHRVDVVEFHPAWHRLMETAVANGHHSLPWEDDPPEGAHVVRAALTYISGQVEAGHNCPISMTYSVIPALLTTPEVAGEWVPGIVSRTYDPSFQPPSDKEGLLLGMGMTEKQGGSDVRANTTQAEPLNGGGPGGGYHITGHKWFTSAPMCDAFLVLAQAPGGLSCFLLPRWTPEGELNRFHIQRLKDKLGNRSNASSEVEFDQAWAVMVGEKGRGVPTIIEMVNGTRLDCVIGSSALMRQAVSQAAWHVSHRAAFGSKLIDKPLMQNVVADLEVETEAATSMMTRLAGAFDRASDDPAEAAMKRIALPIAKYWVTKRTSETVREALECLGGNGYVEESILPRLYRESPLNAIWEGSGNVIALDVLRAASRSPDSLQMFLAELDLASGLDTRLDRAIEGAKSAIGGADDLEFEARRVVERLAITWAGSLLARHGEPVVFEAFAASRLGGDHGSFFGTLPPGTPVADILERAVPQATDS